MTRLSDFPRLRPGVALGMLAVGLTIIIAVNSAELADDAKCKKTAAAVVEAGGTPKPCPPVNLGRR